jgi:hypothetical protein
VAGPAATSPAIEGAQEVGPEVVDRSYTVKTVG